MSSEASSSRTRTPYATSKLSSPSSSSNSRPRYRGIKFDDFLSPDMITSAAPPPEEDEKALKRRSWSRKQPNNSNSSIKTVASDFAAPAGRPSLMISIPTTLKLPPPPPPPPASKVSEKKGRGTTSRVGAKARAFVRGLSRREPQEQNGDDDDFVVI